MEFALVLLTVDRHSPLQPRCSELLHRAGFSLLYSAPSNLVLGKMPNCLCVRIEFY